MNTEEQLHKLADKYREEGYDVLTWPQPSDLPAFLANSQFDLLARKGDHFVALQMKAPEDPCDPEGRPIRLEADLKKNYGRSLLEEAEQLLTPSTMHGALLIAWAAFEAVARAFLRAKGQETEKASPRQLVQSLRESGDIDRDEYFTLLLGMNLRNMIVHGVQPKEIPDDYVPALLKLVRGLLRKQSGGGFEFSGTGISTMRRGEFKDHPEISKLVDEAGAMLNQVLGRWRHRVMVEWKLAEDGEGNQVVVLELADSTGRVTATFRPEEMRDKSHLRQRFTRLWGDLLEIRSHVQVQKLVGSPEE